MGWLDHIGKPYKNSSMKGGGDGESIMSGRQARQYARNTRHCKHGGCNDAPGGHRFDFPGAKDLCLKHAREGLTTRNRNATANASKSDTQRNQEKQRNRNKFKKIQEDRRNKGKGK